MRARIPVKHIPSMTSAQFHTWKKSVLGTPKYELDTPCLVLDKTKFVHNLKAMQNHVNQFNKQLRPHCKTHKSSIIAKLQIETGAIGVCTTKISEAEVLVNRGVRNILVTSPQVTPAKIDRVIECLKIDPNFMIVVDSERTAADLNTAAQQHNVILNILVDVDGGHYRTGIDPSLALSLGQFIHNKCPNLKLRGVQCYLGHIQHVQNYEDRKKRSIESMQKAVSVLNQFKENNLPHEILTGGGTGTHDIDVLIPEVSDIQAGSYVCMDMEYKIIGSAENPQEISSTFANAPMTLLATVVNDQKPLSSTIDAGLKALYKDGPGPKVVYPPVECTYVWKGDEHGALQFSSESQKLKVGTVVELIVSHCDPTINLFDKFYVTEKDLVVDVWPIDLRGCVE